MQTIPVILIGLGAGVLVGLMGIGGGIVVVPALLYLLGMDQHVAQGTSLFMLLPPIGLGALWTYWEKNAVDLKAGVVCAAGILAGGYFGGLVAVGLPSRWLEATFGIFLMIAAVMLWHQARQVTEKKEDHA
jgi:uncharacterized protein